ncbi:hypothetical protein Q0Z83_042790 [Actinoplanes sichuanensis]|uniref:RNA polymerase sigma factor n=1 Tax=Actinoplanes sichuanensis TaxID=512349 RepID=A0ABW4ASL7_9ACTN|nr:sigma-70 family RNA polymerase sigma factor [Actinoplanes sichuanensis]BEL06088.1 hypothetical protein Q0Z83_042790 [Actinoplanes sichuanensis]
MNGVLEPPDEHRGSAPPATPSAPADLRPQAPSADDVAAFSTFYRQEIKPLVNFLLWMGAGLVDATNIAQETMIEVYKQWPSIRRHRAWARSVASRKFGLWRFKIGHEVATEPEILSPLLPAYDNTAAWRQRQDVLRLVATLPERQQQVMAWTLDDFTPQEIAEELGITSEAVRSNLMLARRKLVARLAQEGSSE